MSPVLNIKLYNKKKTKKQKTVLVMGKENKKEKDYFYEVWQGSPVLNLLCFAWFFTNLRKEESESDKKLFKATLFTMKQYCIPSLTPDDIKNHTKLAVSAEDSVRYVYHTKKNYMNCLLEQFELSSVSEDAWKNNADSLIVSSHVLNSVLVSTDGHLVCGKYQVLNSLDPTEINKFISLGKEAYKRLKGTSKSGSKWSMVSNVGCPAIVFCRDGRVFISINPNVTFEFKRK